MCGIYGFITTKPSPEQFKVLVRMSLESASRGKDATGVAWFGPNDKGKVGWHVKKHHVPSDEFYRQELRKYRDGISQTHLCIGHTRAWTVGRPENNQNNHPIHSKSYVMVHNGTCQSTPKVEGYEYNGDVDSELILAQIEARGIRKGLEHSQGTAALAFARLDAEGKELHLFRTANPLILAYDSDNPTIFFASEASILKDALGHDDYLGFFSPHKIRELPFREHWIIDLTPKTNKLRMRKIADIDYAKVKVWGKDDHVGTHHNHRGGYTPPSGQQAVATKKSGITGAATQGKGTGHGSRQELDDRFEWHKYFHIGLNKIVNIGHFAWKWHVDEMVWSHDKTKTIRRYNPYVRRMEVATVEHAIKEGWIKTSPYEESDGKGTGKD